MFKFIKNRKSSELSKKKFFFTYGKIRLLIILVLSFSLLIWKLSGLTYHLANSTEFNTYTKVIGLIPWWKSIINYNGPYYLLLHGLLRLFPNIYGLRLTSVIFGILIILLVYWVTSLWHGYKISLISTIAFITNFAILNIAREGSVYMFQALLLITLIALIVFLHKSTNKYNLVWLIIVMSLLLYIPGSFVLTLITIFLIRKQLITLLNETNLKTKLGLIFLSIIILIPLIYGLVINYSLKNLLYYFGYNLALNHTAYKMFGLNVLKLPTIIFIHSYGIHSSILLGHLPYLAISETVMTIVGLYYYIKHFSDYRWHSVSVIFICGWLLFALNSIKIYSFLPLIYLVIATGLAFLLKQWFDIFPHNHIARRVGIALMSIMIIYTSFYTAHSYFIAWGNDPKVINQYTQKI